MSPKAISARDPEESILYLVRFCQTGAIRVEQETEDIMEDMDADYVARALRRAHRGRTYRGRSGQAGTGGY